MRMIGSFSDETQAGRLGDYLIASGMPNHVEPGTAGDWQVWVERDDDIDRAEAELKSFHLAPADAKYDAAGAIARKVRKERDAKQKQLEKNHIDVRTNWAGRYGRMTLTIVLVALCLVGAVLTKLGEENGPVMQAMNFVSFTWAQDGPPGSFYPGPGIGADLLHGQVWRLITPVFVHLNLLHLFFNMTWLFSLGGMIETRKGPLRLLGLFLVSAVISNFAEYYWAVSRDEFSMAFGMSGVVYGLFGFVWLRGKYAPQEGLGVNQQSVVIMIAWLFICMTGQLGPIANGAHVGGLVIGCALGAWPLLRRKMRPG